MDVLVNKNSLPGAVGGRRGGSGPLEQGKFDMRCQHPWVHKTLSFWRPQGLNTLYTFSPALCTQLGKS